MWAAISISTPPRPPIAATSSSAMYRPRKSRWAKALDSLIFTIDKNGNLVSKDGEFTIFTEEPKEDLVFGREIFNSTNLSFEPSTNLATPPNYRLGPGDEVIIDILGHQPNHHPRNHLARRRHQYRRPGPGIPQRDDSQRRHQLFAQGTEPDICRRGRRLPPARKSR